MKFTREKISKLTGETEVIYSGMDANNGDPCNFKIIASPSGVRFEGNTHLIRHVLELSEFAKTIDLAFKTYKELKPKIEHPGGFKVQ